MQVPMIPQIHPAVTLPLFVQYTPGWAAISLRAVLPFTQAIGDRMLQTTSPRMPSTSTVVPTGVLRAAVLAGP